MNFHVRAHAGFIPFDEAIKERYVADAELHEGIYEIDTVLRLETQKRHFLEGVEKDAHRILVVGVEVREGGDSGGES